MYQVPVEIYDRERSVSMLGRTLGSGKKVIPCRTFLQQPGTSVPERPIGFQARFWPNVMEFVVCWIQLLLDTRPNHTNSAPPPLPIPVDIEGVVKDVVHHTINNQMSTFDLISPDFDILQAIRMTIKALPVSRTEIAHVKGHQDRHKKQWDELLDICAQINGVVLADRQADAIYRSPLLDGLVSFQPGYQEHMQPYSTVCFY
jgi:hypothetical protein